MKYKLNFNNVIIFILIAIMIPPDIIGILSDFKLFDRILAVYSYIFLFYVIEKCIASSNWRRNIFDTYIFLTILVIFFRVLSSILNGTFYITAALRQLVLASFAIWNIYMFRRDSNRILRIYRNILFVYLQINTLLRILIPTGLDPSLLGDRRVWFLSTKNGVTLYILLFLLCALYCWYKSKSGNQVLRLFSVFLICILDSIPLHSATLMLSLLSTFCVIFIGLTFKSRYRKLVHIVCLFLAVIIFLCILSICIGDSSGTSLMVLVARLLGKDPTFSGRVAIWQEAMNYFLSNPLWGCGLGLSYDVWSNGVIVYSAHNAMLNSLAVYGFLTSIIWLISIIYVGYCIFASSKSKMTILLIGCYIGTIISTISEANDTHICLLIIMLFLYCISKEFKNQKVK